MVYCWYDELNLEGAGLKAVSFMGISPPDNHVIRTVPPFKDEPGFFFMEEPEVAAGDLCMVVISWEYGATQSGVSIFIPLLCVQKFRFVDVVESEEFIKEFLHVPKLCFTSPYQAVDYPNYFEVDDSGESMLRAVLRSMVGDLKSVELISSLAYKS